MLDFFRGQQPIFETLQQIEETYPMLKRFFLLSGLALTMAGVQAAPLSNSDFDVTTTGKLVKLCSADREDPLYLLAKGFCLGYIDGAMDYHAGLTAGPEFDPIVCPEGKVTRTEVVMALLEWSQSNPDSLDGEDPVQGVMKAAVVKWPCAR
jgi:hypothetical protein